MLAMVLFGTCGCLSLGNVPPAINGIADVSIATQLMAAAAPVLQPAIFAPIAETPPPSLGAMVVIGPPVTAQGNEVRRSADGLFYVNAIVNGASVRFLIDTGASVVVLTPDDARRAGLDVDDTAYTGTADTANGQTSMAHVLLNEVVVGPTRARAIGAAVVREKLPVSLLGQSWLSQLSSMTIAGDRMLFN